jgi:DNA-binding transcriptional LysR family regulator
MEIGGSLSMLAITMVGGHVSCPIPIPKFVIPQSNNDEWLPRRQIISIQKHQTRKGASCDEWLLHRITLFRQLQGPFHVAVRSKKAALRILPSREQHAGDRIMTRNLLSLVKSAIALAETLNFSRAARMRHISQPTLTKHSFALEDWVGVPLFERDRQAVVINDAGRAFIEEARLSVLYFDRAVQSARAVAQNSEKVLNIGRSPDTDPFLISTLLSIRLPLFPLLKVELSSQFSCDLVHDVLAGSVDLAIAMEPPMSPMLSATKIAQTPFYITMCKEDETAVHQQLSMAALNGREWVLFERRVHPVLYDAIIRVAQEKRVAPAQIHHVMTAEEAFPFIARGRCLAFLTKSGALRIARETITVRPLMEESLSLRTYIAARTDNKSKIVSEFMRSFVKKLSHYNTVKQLQLPMSA